jgi:pentatricopeptide repeat protein
MIGSSPSSSPDPFDQPSEGILDSWKAIANYLKRDVSTVQRWEKREGMPIHRHLHDKRGSVYALPSELDTWLQRRRPQLAENEGRDDDNQGIADATPRIRHFRRWLAIGGVGLLALLAIAYFVIRKQMGSPGTGTIQSVAVLPLTNLSGDPSQQYLADGMTEELIGRLARIRNLRVISRTSVMRFRDTKQTVPEIAKVLNVDAIIEGSVIRDGNRIRVHAQLIRAHSDEHIWAATYDRDLQDVLALESALAEAIASRVEVTVTGEERSRLTVARNVSPEVYESYLKGRFSNDNSPAEVEKSIAFFHDAIRKDPSFAPAYVGLAHAYNRLGTVFIGTRPEEVRPKVVAAVQKALALDPGLAEAHALLADIYQKQWQWSEAEVEYKRALTLDPNSPVTRLNYASWLLCQRRTDEAVAWARGALELDPLGDSGANIGWVLFQARQYENAQRQLRSALGVHPNDAATLWYLGFVLTATGEPQDAISSLEKAVSLSNRSPAVLAILIRAYTQAGRRKAALKLLAEMRERRERAYVPAGAFVNAYLGMGDKENALASLEQAYREQSNILQYLNVHPFFDPLRGDPRFQDLVHRVGLR